MIEQIIYEFISGNEEITKHLATYADTPAVFMNQAPLDNLELWGNGPQYPRIIYELNMQGNPERKVSGFLSVDFYFNTDSDLFIETIEPIIKNELDGCFFSDDTDTMSVQWQQSDPFVSPEDGNRIIGITCTFDVVAFPPQETSYPCPVRAFNKWVKELLPNLIIIGTDKLQTAWKPTDETPAIYCVRKAITTSDMKGNYHVTWFNARLQAYIMAPSSQTRSIILRKIAEQLQIQTRIILEDNSPLMIRSMTLNDSADQLKEGQLTIDTTYGILRTYPQYDTLTNPNFAEVK